MATSDEPAAGAVDPAPPVPAGAALAWDAAITLSLAAYFFFVHSFTRGLLGDVGLSAGVAAKSIVVMVVLAGFILWVAPITDLPRILWRHRLPERRLARGECPRCGQPRDPGRDRPGEAGPCPECGAAPVAPPRWELAARPFLRFAVLIALGMALGGGLAEGRISADERAFLAEVEARPDALHDRPRPWPADFARLQSDPELGPRGTGVIESPQEAGWRPRRPRGP